MESLTRKEIIEMVINEIKNTNFDEFTMNNPKMIYVDEINDKKIKKMNMFLYGKKNCYNTNAVELQFMSSGYGCFLHFDNILLTDLEGEALKELKKKEHNRYTKIIRMTESSIKRTLNKF